MSYRTHRAWIWLTLAGLLWLAPAAHAGDGKHLLWRVEGNRNTVYLLGSIHFLRESDYPLAAALEAAYRDADALVMEIDMDDLDPFATQALFIEKGRIEGNRTLRDLLGAQRFATASELAAGLEMNLEMLQSIEPWYAALTLTILGVQRLGFDPQHGIEMYFSRHARADGKEITGLETIEEQLDFFDTMPLEIQREFLMSTLRDLNGLEAAMEELVGAWRRGDTRALEEVLLQNLPPALQRRLVADRNRAWLPRLEELLDERRDYLVIVGGLHLVGEDGLVQLLRERGYKLIQMGEV